MGAKHVNVSEGMRWGIKVLPEVLVVKVFGRLDQSLEEMFRKVSHRAHVLENRKVILDFSEALSGSSLVLVLCGFGLYHFRQLGIPVAFIRPPAELLPLLLENGVSELSDVFLPDSSYESLN